MSEPPPEPNTRLPASSSGSFASSPFVAFPRRASLRGVVSPRLRAALRGSLRRLGLAPRVGFCALTALTLLGACGESGEAPTLKGDPTAGTSAAGGATSLGGSGGAAGAAAAQPLPPLVRRLTRDEISYTLTDALGLAPSAPELENVPRDRPLEGFVNIATSQTASTEHVMGYARLSRSIAARLDAGFVAAHSTCQSNDSECQSSFVDRVGRILFRRPIEAGEAKLFQALFQSASAEGATFLDGARTVVEGMLQVPQFLYRLEHETAASTGATAGQVRQIEGYEMATRLSYLLWSSVPDQALYDAAQAGSLSDVLGVQREVTRMMGVAERAHRPTERFLTDWAKLESLPNTPLLPELVGSLQAFYADVVWTKSAPLMDLFTARRAFLSPTLAQAYGVTPKGEGFLAYDTAGLPGRVGLLTQPGLVAGMTNADGGAIVARGLFLQSQLLCGDTPSPPPSFGDAIAQFAATQPPNASLRDISNARAARPECGACHQTFDPLAYGLEQFDYQGAFRQVDKFGNTLTTDGWIPGRFTTTGADIAYTGVEDYVAKLVTLPAVGGCLTKQYLQFALGRKLELEGDALTTDMFNTFSAQGGTLAALLAVVVANPLFREMRVEQ